MSLVLTSGSEREQLPCLNSTVPVAVPGGGCVSMVVPASVR